MTFAFPLFALLAVTLLTGQSFGDIANDQLDIWASQNGHNSVVATDARGCPVPSLTASLGVGSKGPLLLQDTNFLDHLGQFVRSRSLPRSAHAKGFLVSGYFETQHDITMYTKAVPFNRMGKRTPVSIRFSTTVGDVGSSDAIPDGRGFAVKFFTEDGNWDLVGNALPIFPIKDPVLFPSLIASRRGNPRTGFSDPNSFWDFLSLRPESTAHTMLLFSDSGVPDGFRHMNGFGVNTFKLVNAKGEPVYCKFHWKCNQGVKYLVGENVTKIPNGDPNYSARDLFNAIESRNFPSWDLGIQVMTFEQAKIYRWDPFDVTKFWLLEDFPLIPVGKMVLNTNPRNFFQDSDQAGFTPSNMIPGIEPSPDRLLQGRMFSYGDALRHRLGTNWNHLPANRPHSAVHTYVRDGSGAAHGQDNSPNYFPNSFGGPRVDPKVNMSSFTTCGDVVRVDTGDEDNYSQASWLWNNDFDESHRQRLVDNLARSIKQAIPRIRDQVYKNMFAPVHANFAGMLKKALDITDNTPIENIKVKVEPIQKKKCPPLPLKDMSQKNLMEWIQCNA